MGLDYGYSYRDASQKALHQAQWPRYGPVVAALHKVSPALDGVDVELSAVE